jgi:hypothetical protein
VTKNHSPNATYKYGTACRIPVLLLPCVIRLQFLLTLLFGNPRRLPVKWVPIQASSVIALFRGGPTPVLVAKYSLAFTTRARTCKEVRSWQILAWWPLRINSFAQPTRAEGNAKRSVVAIPKRSGKLTNSSLRPSPLVDSKITVGNPDVKRTQEIVPYEKIMPTLV